MEAFSILTLLAYLAHRRQRRALIEDQLHHNEALLDIARGVRKAMEELNTRPSFGTPLSPSTSNENLEKIQTLTPIWNVPYHRNPFFTGREHILKRLHDRFTAGESTSTRQPQAICGLGGIGKTQSAVEYAYRYREDYKAVLWARADSRETLVADFVTIANLLKLPQKDAKDQNLAVSAVKSWLETNTDWLLILDEVEDLNMASHFLSTGSKGHTLLISRAQAMGTIAQSVELEKMEPEEGVLFLLRRAKIIMGNVSLDTISASDHTIARDIVQAMDRLPLALDQAGAYIEETACKLSDYLHIYQTQHADLLKVRGGLIFDHPEPVATTWSLAFEKVQQEDPAAADLLRLCAFLAPDAIPEEIFTQGPLGLSSNLQQFVSNPHKLNTAVKTLLKFSLVHRNAGIHTLDIHRLVQTMLRYQMNKETQHQWAERSVRVINHIFPSVDVTNWSSCQRYLPHALVCAILIKQAYITTPEAARLLNQAGYYLYERAQYVEAETLWQEALEIYKKLRGQEHPDTANSFNNLALLYHKQAKYKQAELLYQKALEIRERVLGPDHPDTANSLDNLALLYERQGKYEQGQLLLQRALEICEHVLGPDHPSTANSFDSLAWLNYKQGKYEEAELLYQHALDIYKHVLNSDHPATASTLFGLATLYERLGKYEQAESIHLRALEIRERMLGPDHPDTSSSLNGLARLYYTQERYEEAEPLYQRALEMRERLLPPDHPYIASSLNGLAELYERQGKYKQAEPLHLRALGIRERVLGPNHPATSNSLNGLALLYFTEEQYEKAEPLLQRAIAIREQVLGPEHPDTANTLNRLAELYVRQGRYEQAEPLFQRALSIRKRVLGLDHSLTLFSLKGLATLYERQGKYDQARSLYYRRE